MSNKYFKVGEVYLFNKKKYKLIRMDGGIAVFSKMRGCVYSKTNTIQRTILINRKTKIHQVMMSSSEYPNVSFMRACDIHVSKGGKQK